MTKYIVRASRNLDYSFIVEANSKEEAEEVYYRLRGDGLNDAISDVAIGDLDVVWDVEEATSDAKTYKENGGWEQRQDLAF
jgi:hypothetical protein